MRVISGIFKGRILNGYKLQGTRPTMDKVKESVFAMIQVHIKDSVCLDLFAGSGSLGIEALSNGASLVYFVDKSRQAIDIIKKNIGNLGVEDKTNVILDDYNNALNYFEKQKIKFDIIFLDPPYKDEVISKILTHIESNDLLNDNGLVVCEYTTDELLDEYGNLNSIKQRSYGDKIIKIYKSTLS